MAKNVSVVINEDADEGVVQRLATVLRSNNPYAEQVREFVDTITNDPVPLGLQFSPTPGQILICHFGLGFQKPEMVKTRPALVVSAKRKDGAKLCTVLPISSLSPEPVRPFHLKLPEGIIPTEKYRIAWIKGDMIQTVACHRLDRVKTGFREYKAIIVPPQVLTEAMRCVLHALGMHALTEHWK